MRYLFRFLALAVVALSVLAASPSPASNIDAPDQVPGAVAPFLSPVSSAPPAAPFLVPEPPDTTEPDTEAVSAPKPPQVAPGPAGHVADGPVTAPKSAPDGAVLVVGDSLTVGSANTTKTSSSQVLAVDAEVGRSVRTGIEKLRSNDAAGSSLIVFALGTNDHLASPSQVASWVAQVAEASGGRPVIWVNLDTGGSMSGAATFNGALTSAAADHPNITVADWDSHIAGRVGLRAGDGIHYTAAGYQTRGAWLADIIG